MEIDRAYDLSVRKRADRSLTGTGPGPEDSAPTIPFGPVLGLLVVVAVGARVAYTLTIGQHLKLGLDATGYILLAAGLASGHGYANPAFVFSGFNKATANFVPGYPLFLAGLLKLGITTRTGFQLAGALCGGLTALLTGFFARRISGRASVGLVAAGLVAVSPVLIASDGSVMSETIAVPLTVGLLLAAAWAGAEYLPPAVGSGRSHRRIVGTGPLRGSPHRPAAGAGRGPRWRPRRDSGAVCCRRWWP